MKNELKFYLRLLSRRFAPMVILFLLAACIGTVVALRLPPTYQASATLLVEAPQIPDNVVRSAVQTDVTEQLEVIQERLMTRANLISLARNNRVFPNQSMMEPDTVVREMRRMTNIRRASGRGRATLITVSFTGRSPLVVADVVNAYVSLILETNSEFRTSRAEGTLDFFQQEVQRLSDDLDAQNAKIISFKRENSDALPENLDYRLNRQSLLQERLSRAEREIQALDDQREDLRRLYGNGEGTIFQSASQQAQRTPEQNRLRELRSELNAALAIYSEENPKVKLLRTQVASQEERVRAMLEDQMAGQNAGAEGQSPEQVMFDRAMSEIDQRQAALRDEVATANEELATLQDSIDRTPTNRIELDAMERDQSNIRNLYSAAVQRLAEARMTERVELSARGQRIIVLEPASVPNSASGPNRAKIIGMGFGVGLALAGGFFLLLELLNQSIRRPREIVNALNITPLATIPKFESAIARRRRRIRKILAFVVLVIIVLASLWAVDTYYMPLDQLFDKVMDRLL